MAINEYCYDRENKNLLVRYSEDGTLEKYVYGNALMLILVIAKERAGGFDRRNPRDVSYEASKSVTVECNGSSSSVYRGGNDFTVKPNEEKLTIILAM